MLSTFTKGMTRQNEGLLDVMKAFSTQVTIFGGGNGYAIVLRDDSCGVSRCAEKRIRFFEKR